MSPRELLRTGAEEIGIPLSPGQVDRYFVYLAELKKWNQRINLTSITTERDTVIKHLLDSLAYVTAFAPDPGMRLLDMGSGAGFPAIPIKIALPEMEITLVESVKKKASFLRHIVRTLRLSSVEIKEARINELPGSCQAYFDLVTARAFAGMEAALAEGTPLLKTGGRVILSRGAGETITELRSSQLGFRIERRLELTLPHSDYKRAIWVFRKNA